MVQTVTFVILLSSQQNRQKVAKILKVKQRAFYDRLDTTFKFAKVIKTGIETNIRSNYKKTNVLFLEDKKRYAYVSFSNNGQDYSFPLPYDEDLEEKMKNQEVYLYRLVKNKAKKFKFLHPPGIPYFYTAKQLNCLAIEIKDTKTQQSKKFKGTSLPRWDFQELEKKEN